MIPAFWKKLIRYNPQKERDARRNLSTLHFYLLAVFLSVFFTLVVLSFWFTWQVKKFYGGDSYTSQVLNIASDIRNYSQNMVMQSLFVHNELMLLEDKDFLEDKLEDAKEAFYFFSYGHFQLQGEADGEQIPAAQKETLEALFVQIDPHFRSIEDAFHSYGDLFKDDIFDQQKASREIRKLIDTVVEYLNVMERIVREYTLAGEVQARKNMWMVLPLHLGILLLVLSLYWPVMRRVRHSISDLARANKQMQEEISKRQLSERERDRLAMAVEQAIDGIIVSDDKGNIRYANKTMTNFCECEAATSDNWHNSVLDICVLKDDGAYTKVEEALRTGKTWQGHITRENNQGLKQELMLSVSPVMEHLGGIKGFIGMLRDITTEHELEGQLRQAQKLEAVGVLAGGVAHDFNNMLQVIGGYAELSLKHAGEHEGLQKGLNKIIKSVKSASSLTKRLLAFSRKEVLKKKPLNFNRFIEEQISLLKRVIRADIDIEFDKLDDRAVAEVDPNMMEQIFVNLCLNAQDAMPEGGRLRVELSKYHTDPEFFKTHSWAKASEYIIIKLQDNGSGMPEEVQEHIFEPFFTTKAPGKGSGLGLAMVYGIVRQHKGMITVNSTLGEGSTFTIYLPSDTQDEEVQADEDVVVQTSLEGHETILVAEDEPEVHDLLVSLLRNKGYHVIQARDGMEALEAFNQNQDRIDLALLDMVMPKINGRQLYEHFISHKPGLKVIFSTGYASEFSDREEQFEEGDVPMLRKPYSTTDLLQALRKTLDKAGETEQSLGGDSETKSDISPGMD